MAIIALKAWYINQYEPIKSVVKRPHDLRLSRNSLLKTGLRADMLDDSQQVKQSEWFERYLEGETVEFYIEGSGSYIVSNIDLISQEIYFSKLEINSIVEPVIYFSHQKEYPASSEVIKKALDEAIEKINQRSRLTLTLQENPYHDDKPIKLTEKQMRTMRTSMMFVADVTAVTQLDNNLILSPKVCLEMGYGLQNRRYGTILLLKMERSDISGKYPFDLPNYQELEFKTKSQLSENLLPLLETLLQRFSLFS